MTLLALICFLAACGGGEGLGGTTTSSRPATTDAAPSTTLETTSTTAAATTTSLAAATTTSTDPSAGTAAIRIRNFTFLTGGSVSVGDTVVVTNEDDFSHTWTSDDGIFDSGTLSSGSSFSFTFDEPGEYPFFCKFHPSQMTGTIVVSP